jgi:heat shock protein HslJ
LKAPAQPWLNTLTRRPFLWLVAPVWLGLQACANSAAPAPARESVPSLWGTQWQLQALGSEPVMAQSRASLHFPQEGRVAGNGSCNRFTGSVTVQGDRLTFGNMASTKMACPGEAMGQERSYMAALQKAQRYEQQGNILLIHTSDMAQPLRFSRAP